MNNIYKYTRKELEKIMIKMGQPSFRSNQIFNWLYKKKCEQFNQMTNLPKSLIQELDKRFIIKLPEIISMQKSSDGTQKFLLNLSDGFIIETVYIPEENHHTVCLSSQVGCPLKCSFCVSGKVEYKRNLYADEIIAQLLIIYKTINLRGKINIVLMGMGEPLLNLDNVMVAIEIITDKEGLSISRRNITISTAGYVPGLKKLKEYDVIPKIAFSLNAASNEVRSMLMPINKQFPIDDVLETLASLKISKRERITIEYVMIKDVNDSLNDAGLLVKMLKKIPCKINLIPLNQNDCIPYKSSDQSEIEKFANYLRERNFTVTIRKSRGKDIDAACGLLKYKSSLSIH